MRKTFIVLPGLMIGLWLPELLHAQERQPAGPSVAAFVGGSFGDGGTGRAAGASIGFQFRRQLGFELEIAHLPNLRLVTNPCPPSSGDCSLNPMQLSGRALTWLGYVVKNFSQSGRVRPYVLAGGGIATIRRTCVWSIHCIDSSQAVTRHLPALSGGGGLELMVLRHLGIAADARYVFRFGEGGLVTSRSVREPLNMARATTRVVYRF
jgi:hypothetical protein